MTKIREAVCFAYFVYRLLFTDKTQKKSEAKASLFYDISTIISS